MLLDLGAVLADFSARGSGSQVRLGLLGTQGTGLKTGAIGAATQDTLATVTRRGNHWLAVVGGLAVLTGLVAAVAWVTGGRDGAS